MEKNNGLFELMTKMYSEFTGKFDKIHSDMKEMKGDIKTLNIKFDGLETKFDGLENKVNNLETKVDKRFDAIDQRFDEALLEIGKVVTKEIGQVILDKIDSLEQSLSVVELVSSKNMSDIARLKLIK